MTYTKKFGSSAKVTIDGVDVSNSFSSFSAPSENAREPAGGFNATGYEETLAGTTTRRFVGTAWYTEELAALVYPLHNAKTAVVITYQPDGLADPTREIFSGLCIINEFGPESTFGSVSSMPFSADPSTEAGITVGNFT